MSETGDTEWNVFLDALGWHVVTRVVADFADVSIGSPPVYVITSGATEEMPITMADFKAGVVGIESKVQSNFIKDLAASFLGAGEAKWWDAQLVVAMADVIEGLPIEESVCSHWMESTGFKIELAWRRVNAEQAAAGVSNPYGSITDVPGLGPRAFFCRHGNVTNMQQSFWEQLSGTVHNRTIANASVYLRKLPPFGGSCPAGDPMESSQYC